MYGVNLWYIVSYTIHQSMIESSKICKHCGHSCHCRDVCTVRTDDNETVSACDCSDCRCDNGTKA